MVFIIIIKCNEISKEHTSVFYWLTNLGKTNFIQYAFFLFNFLSKILESQF